MQLSKTAIEKLIDFPLGIIGGAGVRAVNRFLYLLERKITTSGAFRDCHHPEIILYGATQAPSRSMFLEGKGEDFTQNYINVAQSLEKCGAKSLCMTCITAHACWDKIIEKVGIPMINLLDVVAQRIADLDCERIGILCSNGSVIAKVWERYICARIIYPAADFQDLLTTGICLMKKGNDESAISHYNAVVDHIENLQEMRGGGIVLGCTDIALFSSQIKSGLPIISVLDVLADYVCECWNTRLKGKVGNL
ncbi:MAG: amino acid racemase [Holosporales bacterium]|jgi:aspartate racemase|nr:amino acid racemase [Holosporales bacterium]